MSSQQPNDKHDWWKGAVFYQIYPRSFLDSNGSGVGDLQGITARLDYVASLGVDALWISPFFKSPMKDFGYDVSDYRAIDPLFGTLEDFDALLDKAHSLGLKLIIDLVLSHTSDEHPWFQNNPDYYVWADGKPDGSPPNNWVSIFGGSAWEYCTKRKQYYLHNFLKEQPDLNYHNPHVQEEALDICRFWLNRGVDGFRLDTINFLFHDEALRGNPPRKADLGAATQFEGEDPYSTQTHLYDKSRPEMLPFLEKLRAVMDEYPGTMTLGEIGDDHPYALAGRYSAPGRLNTNYNPQMMAGTQKELTASLIRTPIEETLKQGGWPSWAFSNHDVVRAASRWLPRNGTKDNGFAHDPRLSKMLIALLGCLYGSVFIYQGEELGLPEARLSFDELQDPWGKALWPEWQGRDGCRTPLPWDEQSLNQKTWLPVPEQHRPLNVEAQSNDPHSTLAFTQKFLHWRKSQTILQNGEINFIETGNEKILAFERKGDEQTITCLFNLDGQSQMYKGEALEPYEFQIDGFTF